MLPILPCLPPGYLSSVAMRARVGSEYPLLPVHGVTCWPGVFFMSLVNVMGDVSPCNMRGTNNMRQRASVQVRVCIYVSEDIYVDLFCRVSQQWTTASHNTRAVLYPNTQPNGLGYGRGICFLEARAWTLISTTHTDLSIRDTPKPVVPPVNWLRACVCMPLF